MADIMPDNMNDTNKTPSRTPILSVVRFPGWKKVLLLPVVAIVGMVIGALLFASVMAGEIYEFQDTVDGVHLPQVDAIVVLAGGRGRISNAGDLWNRYREQFPRDQVPVLYVSGMGHQSSWSSFARQLRRGVLEVIRPENVVLETESMNTEENARWLVRTVRQRGWKKILLTTSSYHMKRARMMLDETFRSLGTPVAIETLSIYQDPFEQAEWRSSFIGFRVTLIEYLKLIYYKHFWVPDSANPQVTKILMRKVFAKV
jgi:uncharacterized SAM-binding protein YcdF (DUF218 family)